MITLRNDFHNTFVRIRASVGDALSQHQVRRVRTLCGMDDCTCGGLLSIRGPQDGATVIEDYPGEYVVVACG